MSQTKCPKCGNAHLQVVVTQFAEVMFFDDAEGTHEVKDVYGDVEFDRTSPVVCAARFGGCGHTGTLGDFTTGGLTEADKAALASLRRRGFAVTVFNPDELGGLDSERIETVMTQSGEDAIELLSKG